MSDNVDSLLTQIQERIEGGKRFGRLRMVDPQELQDLLESVRAAMPNTIERAREIVAKRTEIIEGAREDAEGTLADARQKSAELEASTNARVQEVVQHAKERVLQMRAQGEQIVEAAKAEAARLVEQHTITLGAQEQAEQMLRQARAAAEKIELESRQQCEQAISSAQGYSQDLLRRTEDWGMQYTEGVRSVVEEIVNEAEEILASSLTEIRGTKKRLQVTMTKSAKPPEFYPPEEPGGF
ncbi:MAG: hypothetical protein LBG83_01605 [Oscillospiraceae bacterium]|jgi:vacuolar-type H+-ATPase subunit H|nr:hypothetical protein [Oscillospiraceae bacterium]